MGFPVGPIMGYKIGLFPDLTWYVVKSFPLTKTLTEVSFFSTSNCAADATAANRTMANAPREYRLRYIECTPIVEQPPLAKSRQTIVTIIMARSKSGRLYRYTATG